MIERNRLSWAAAALVGAGLTGCATDPAYPVRPGEPRATFEAPKPAYPIRPPAAAAAAPAPPSAAAGPAAPPPPADIDTPPPIRPEPIPSQAKPRSASRSSKTAGPRTAAPAATTTVGPDESAFEVAERVRTPVQALLDANGLKSPYDVSPGDRLTVPPSPVHVVQSGDTLSSLGRRYAIQPRSLALLNDLAPDARLHVGQRLVLPVGAEPQGAAPPSVERGAAAPSRVAVSTPPLPPSTPPRPLVSPSAAPAPVPPAEPSTDAAAAVAAGRGKFVWPVKGEILSTFGPKGPGQRNDGVNIAAVAGEPVKAAAAGAVVYAGNSIPGFGNLVVVKHPDGWTSLYGNLGKITVKIRAQVAQGDALGVAGQSGTVDRPQVHFEVRYAAAADRKAKPVDPQSLLP